MVSLSHKRRPTNPDRMQKSHLTVNRLLPLRFSKTTSADRYHQSTSELNGMATIAVSPTSGARQESCSSRTRLYDDESQNDDLDDITYGQPSTLLSRTVPGNPQISPSEMLFPTTPIAEDTIPSTDCIPMSESNDRMSFSFVSLEEFTDTEMVDAVYENTRIPNSTRKRKSSFSAAVCPHTRKRKFTITPRALRLGQRGRHGTGGMEEEDISDNWSIITDADMARIPMYKYNNFVDMKQSVQVRLLRHAISKARLAKRKMHSLERSCRTLFWNTFEQPGHAGPTQCIAVGSGW